ncbi:pRL2-8 [Streptomyces sp. NPDC002853]
MGLFGIPSCPPGQCPQCWQHAYDKNAHKGLGPREDCPACLNHLATNCNGFYRK